jgi:hypothetical protein
MCRGVGASWETRSVDFCQNCSCVDQSAQDKLADRIIYIPKGLDRRL